MIIVDEISKSFLSVSFRYCNLYVNLLRKVRKTDSRVTYKKKYNYWVVPKETIDELERVCSNRLVWRKPKWKILNLPKPNYEELYKTEDYELPKLKNASLYNYQEYTAKFMIDRLDNYGLVINSMSVGLGKSITSISAYLWLKQNRGIKKGIIICPSTLKEQWKEEVVEAFTEEKSVILDGTKKKREKQIAEFANLKEGLLIMNPHLLLHDLELLLHLDVDLILLDEAQNLKSRTGKMNTALKNLVSKKQSDISKMSKINKQVLNSKPLGKPIHYMCMLTATPIKSHPDNLYGLMRLKDSSILGSWDSFDKAYMDYDIGYVGRMVKNHVGYKNLSKLKDIVDKYTIRLTEHEVSMELPEVQSKIISVPMDNVQKKMNEEALSTMNDASAKYYKLKTKDTEQAEKLYGLMMLSSMCQFAIANDPRIMKLTKSKGIQKKYLPMLTKTYSMSPKTETLLDILESIESSGGKAIVFSIFERQVRLLKADIEKRYPGRKAVIISGEQTDDENNEAKNDFKYDYNTFVLLSTEKGHEGLNLQHANNIIHYDLPKTQDGVLQRRGRARRVGSNHVNINEFFLITKNSADVTRYNKLKSQKAMSDGILVSDEAQSNEIKQQIGGD